MFDFIKDWGPESLLALIIFLFFMGWVTPRYILSREIKNLKDYYENRLEEQSKAHTMIVSALEKHHEEVVTNLRSSQDVAQQALTQAVHNNQRVVRILDDYADLTRIAAPALVARQDVLEGRNDSG
jgi:hypothetical protein